MRSAGTAGAGTWATLAVMALLPGMTARAFAAEAQPAGRVVKLLFADGATAIPGGASCEGATVPPAHRCDLDGASSPEACRAAIISRLQLWYAAYDVTFIAGSPDPAEDTIVITSDGQWCGAPRGLAGEAPERCQPAAGSVAYVYDCTGSAQRCAGLIAHEHGHLLGLQHVAESTDVMAEGGCVACAGFLDQDTPVIPPGLCGRTHQNGHRLLLQLLGPRSDGQEPPGCALVPGLAARPPATVPLLMVLLLGLAWLRRRRRSPPGAVGARRLQ